MKKCTTLLLGLLLMGATATKAQSAQQDFDDKYATELVKVGTAAPDFKMKTPDGKTIQPNKLLFQSFSICGKGLGIQYFGGYG